LVYQITMYAYSVISHTHTHTQKQLVNEFWRIDLS